MKKLRGVAVCGVIFGLMLSVAAAAKLTGSFAVPLPSIKKNGNLNFNNLGVGTLTIKINTRSGRIVARANGSVENKSGKKQVFKNDDILGPVIKKGLGGPGGVTVDEVNELIKDFAKIRRLRYTVAASDFGDAKATGVGVVKVKRSVIQQIF
ncbi:hypothetical protein [Thalassoglobus sp.]|uniref:hypothetical protein n=1 Tax=Thalassoglobus sp. TaxID=2795869 RepID=UPI003AA9D895